MYSHHTFHRLQKFSDFGEVGQKFTAKFASEILESLLVIKNCREVLSLSSDSNNSCNTNKNSNKTNTTLS